MTTAKPDLEKLRALAEASTPVPWRRCSASDDPDLPRRIEERRHADKCFIEAARAAVPWLLDRVAELERELAEANAELAGLREIIDVLAGGKEVYNRAGEAEDQRDAAQRENAIMRKALEQAVSSPDLGALYGIVRAGVRDDAFGQGAREALKALGNIVAEYSKAAREALSACSPAPANISWMAAFDKACEGLEDIPSTGRSSSPAPAAEGPPRWRVGRTLGRTLYRDEMVVGMVDTPEMAAEIVAAVNREPQETP